MLRNVVLVLVAVFVLLVVIAGVVTPHLARAAVIATDEPNNAAAPNTITAAAPNTITSRTTGTTSIATDAPAQVVRMDDSPSPPHDVMLGRFLYEPYMVTNARTGARDMGGRFGVDMIAANGDGATKLGGGIRFTLGGDGAAAFGTEGQLLIGVTHTISDRAALALVAPLGFALGGGHEDFAPHGYAGIEGVAAVGKFAREQGPGVRGVELAAGISNRGARARIGIVRPGKEVGWGVGVDWQRENAYDLVGVYFATTAGR